MEVLINDSLSKIEKEIDHIKSLVNRSSNLPNPKYRMKDDIKYAYRCYPDAEVVIKTGWIIGVTVRWGFDVTDKQLPSIVYSVRDYGNVQFDDVAETDIIQRID